MERRQGYNYQALGPRQIRVLFLDGYTKDSVLNGKLKPVTLDLQQGPSQPYEALSYVWGKEPPCKPLIVDGQKILITSNCDSGLRRFQGITRSTKWPRRWGAPRRQPIWVDAICIDQDPDKAERNTQVEMMADIYRMASRVNVWLNPMEEDISKDLAYLEKFISTYVRMHDPKKKPLEVGTRGHTAMERHVSYYANETPKRFFEHHWFDRIWVVQEAVIPFARGQRPGPGEVRVCYGSTELDWSTMLQAMCSIDKPPENWVYLMTKLHLFKGLTAAVGSEEPGFKFSHILHLTTPKLATDPRDKVYGVLATARQFGCRTPPVDYRLSVGEVYAQAARCAYEQDGTLELLETTEWTPYIEGLPSWAPDLSVQQGYTQPASLPRSRDSWCASGSSRLWCQFHETDSGPIMQVRGRRIDMIGECGSGLYYEPDMMTPEAMVRYKFFSLKVNELYETQPKGLEKLRSWLLHLDALYSGDPALLVLEGGGLRRSYGQTSTASATVALDHRPLLHAFAHILVDRSSVAATRRAHTAKGGRDFGEDPDEDSLLILCHDLLRHWFVGKRRKDSVLLPAFRGLSLDEHSHTSNAFSFLYDILLVHNRTKLVITKDGYFGTARLDVRAGDQVVLIEGASMPAVLREVRGSPGDPAHPQRWRYIGPAYLHGMMYGELWDDSDADLSTFDIE